MSEQTDICGCDVFLGEFSDDETEIRGCDTFLGEFTDDAEGQPCGYGGAAEQSDESLYQFLTNAEDLLHAGHVNAAFLIAWAGLEAAMRGRLRAAGEKAGWGSMPRDMLNELYSAGILSPQELPQLEGLFRLRNQLAHGFVAQPSDGGTVQFVIDTARRLLTESQAARKTA